jgi:hypothetical protein
MPHGKKVAQSIFGTNSDYNLMGWMFRYLNFSRALKHCDGYHSLPASSYPSWIHQVSESLLKIVKKQLVVEK